MFKNLVKVLVVICLVVLCDAGYAAAAPRLCEEKTSLCVGISTDSPPLAYRVNEKISGVEADLARLLGKELNRPVAFADMKWDQLIPALLEGKIDIIMSGMSITNARKVRINFSDPYLKGGLVGAIRAEDTAKFPSAASIMSGYPSVGVIAGTTGEAFVRKNMAASPRIAILSRVRDAVFELQSRRIDVFIHDAPAVIWLVSENEADIAGVWETLSEESFGWGIRKDNNELLIRVNALLQTWKEDGTLNGILRNWLPPKYMERFK